MLVLCFIRFRGSSSRRVAYASIDCEQAARRVEGARSVKKFASSRPRIRGRACRTYPHVASCCPWLWLCSPWEWLRTFYWPAETGGVRPSWPGHDHRPTFDPRLPAADHSGSESCMRCTTALVRPCRDRQMGNSLRSHDWKPGWPHLRVQAAPRAQVPQRRPFVTAEDVKFSFDGTGAVPKN